MNLIFSLMIFALVGSSKAVADSGASSPVCADVVVDADVVVGVDQGQAQPVTSSQNGTPKNWGLKGIARALAENHGLPLPMIQKLRALSKNFSNDHYTADGKSLSVFFLGHGLSLALGVESVGKNIVNGKGKLIFQPSAQRASIVSSSRGGSTEEVAFRQQMLARLAEIAERFDLRTFERDLIFSVDLNFKSDGTTIFSQDLLEQIYSDFTKLLLEPLGP